MNWEHVFVVSFGVGTAFSIGMLIFAVFWERRSFQKAKEQAALKHLLDLQKLAEKEASAKAINALKTAEARWWSSK